MFHEDRTPSNMSVFRSPYSRPNPTPRFKHRLLLRAAREQNAASAKSVTLFDWVRLILITSALALACGFWIKSQPEMMDLVRLTVNSIIRPFGKELTGAKTEQQLELDRKGDEVWQSIPDSSLTPPFEYKSIETCLSTLAVPWVTPQGSNKKKWEKFYKFGREVGTVSEWMKAAKCLRPILRAWRDDHNVDCKVFISTLVYSAAIENVLGGRHGENSDPRYAIDEWVKARERAFLRWANKSMCKGNDGGWLDDGSFITERMASIVKS
eukprot:UC4_evm8s1211